MSDEFVQGRDTHDHDMTYENEQSTVTIPLKEKVVNFTDKVDKVVFTTKAINTLIFHKKKVIKQRC